MGNTLKFKKKKEIDTSDSDRLRNQCNSDWRTQKTELVDQIVQLYQNEELTDVLFVFNRKDSTTKIAVHQLVLCAASEVFKKEIAYARQTNCGIETSEEGEHGKLVTSSLAPLPLEIEVNDPRVEPDALRTMVEYIYESYKDVSLSGDSVMAVLYVAKKYLVCPLINLCETFLLNNICAENVFTVLQYTIDCESDTKLKEKCAEIICAKTKDVLKSEEFPKISSKCLEFLLDQDSLTTPEVEVFNAAIQWAKSNVDEGAKDKSELAEGKILRQKLAAVFHLIRFGAMSANEFLEFVDPTGVFNAEESLDVIRMINGQKTVGQLICNTNCVRREIIHFSSSKILKQSTQRTFKFSILVHIENFPSFVTSKAEYESVSIHFNNTEWYIKINLRKYCQTKEYYISVTSSSSDQPETLAAFVFGRRRDRKECSFNVDATSKFIQPDTAQEDMESHKFVFSSTKQCIGWGRPEFARIDDILNEGYLVDNSLELLVDVSISECE